MERHLQKGLEGGLLAAIGVAVLLRAGFIARREFWYDEVLSLLLSTGQKIRYQPPGESPVALAGYGDLLHLPPENSLGAVLGTVKALLQGIVGVEPHPPLFYLSEHGWLRLFGNSEASLRSLMVLMSVGAIAAAYGLGRTLGNHRLGLLLAALVGLNPFLLFHAMNVRMYGPTVFWVILSGWAMVQLLFPKPPAEENAPAPLQRTWLWTGVLIVAIAGGFLTFYLFVYWMFPLACLALILDPRGFWRHGLRLAAGVGLTVPWLWWGLPQQLRNADLERFAADVGLFSHLNGLVQTLGIHLVWGDWATQIAPLWLTLVGGLVTLAFLGLVVTLVIRAKGLTDRRLKAALVMGCLPLPLALTADVVNQSSTLAWGWGRSVIFAVPGLLLLVALWLEHQPPQRRPLWIGGVLALYLIIGGGDLALRHRQMFHGIDQQVQQAPQVPTLIAMDSLAWGHVLRLAYYVDPTAQVDLLAAHPADLASVLDKTLSSQSQPYERLFWLQPADPLWRAPETPAAALAYQAAIETVLGQYYTLSESQSFSGTMSLDQFTLRQYRLLAAGTD